VGHTYTNLLYHIIFSTKNRLPYLQDEARRDVFAYMGGIARTIGAICLIVGGHDDHVHLLSKLPASLAVADFTKKVKANSSRWIHQQRVLPERSVGKEGYAAFSVSESSAEAVSRYIANQARHHQKKTFQGELIEFLKRHRLPYDERYIWR
jgi:REP-associated tyrosine transposase